MNGPPRSLRSVPPEGTVSPLGRPCGTDMKRPRSAGFSLIEVLAAFGILALVATALFRLFSGSLNNASAAEEWSRALLLAEAQLDIAASAQTWKAGTQRGSDGIGRIRWESRVDPYSPPATGPDHH